MRSFAELNPFISLNYTIYTFHEPNPAKYYKIKFNLYQKYSQWNLVLILQCLVVLSGAWQEPVKFTFLCDLGNALFPDLEWNLRRKEFTYQFHKFRKRKVLRLKQSGIFFKYLHLLIIYNLLVILRGKFS